MVNLKMKWADIAAKTAKSGGNGVKLPSHHSNFGGGFITSNSSIAKRDQQRRGSTSSGLNRHQKQLLTTYLESKVQERLMSNDQK